MPIVDILSAALSGPAGRLVEGPVRTIVNEVLQDHGYASPAELQALRDDLRSLSDLVQKLSAELDRLRDEAAALRQRAADVADVVAPSADAADVAAPPAEDAAGEDSAPSAAAADTSAADAAPPMAAEAERLGMTLDDYNRWRTEGLPGVIGPDGMVTINGVAYRVDPSLEGKPYTLSKHKSPRVRVDGVFVSKSKVG